MRNLLISFVFVLSAACGTGTLSPSRELSTSQALTGTAEWLEFEPASRRVDLFREVARTSQLEAGTTGAVLFPVLQDGQYVAAPGLDPRSDLLLAPDAGAPLILTFDARSDPFSEERRDAWQGLSEREATELVARTLLHHWGISPPGAVVVMRSAGAPYAAAYMDGVLRINPAFVYMAAAPSTP